LQQIFCSLCFFSVFRTLINLLGDPQTMKMMDVDNDIMRFTNLTNYQELIETFPANYQLQIGNTVAGEIQLRLGGVYTLIIRETTPSNFVSDGKEFEDSILKIFYFPGNETNRNFSAEFSAHALAPSTIHYHDFG
jgi:hypothetical protein